MIQPSVELPTAPPRVLVVDDDPGIRDVLLLSLEDEGYEARAVENGAVALALLAAWQPNVIILDLMMPVMDGWTFRAQQLAHVGWASIPAIVLSAHYNVEGDLELLQAAAVFSKPFNVEDFLATVGAIVP